MSETETPAKSRLPLWVKLLGGGCLVLLALGVAAVLYVVNFVRKSTDPERQWPQIAAYLPHDERPEGWTIFAVPTPGSDVEMWTLQRPDSTDQITLARYPAADAQGLRRALFEERELEADAPILGAVGRFDPVRGSAVVQGRELVVLRYFTTPATPEKPDGLLGKIQSATASSNLLVDLSEGPDGDLITFEIRRPGTRSSIPDEDLARSLEPFRIGEEPR